VSPDLLASLRKGRHFTGWFGKPSALRAADHEGVEPSLRTMGAFRAVPCPAKWVLPTTPQALPGVTPEPRGVFRI